MKRVWLGVVLAIFAVAPCGGQPNAPRLVVLALTMPGGAHPQLTIAEGGMGSVTLPAGRTPSNVSVIPGATGGPSFGFKPTVRDAAAGTVAVDVLDLRSSPYRKIGTVVATVGGPSVSSGTMPGIDIRIDRIVMK